MRLHYKVAIEQIEQVQIDFNETNLLVQKRRGEQQTSTDRLIDTNE